MKTPFENHSGGRLEFLAIGELTFAQHLRSWSNSATLANKCEISQVMRNFGHLDAEYSSDVRGCIAMPR